jgi:hypothetical protein
MIRLEFIFQLHQTLPFTCDMCGVYIKELHIVYNN